MRGGLRLGALTTCTDLLRSALARERADILVQAAAECGAVQIQNRATLGGNLDTASTAADLVPVLMALGATVRLVSARDPRERRAFRKVGTRAAQSISKVVLAVALVLEGPRVASVRAAAGAVAPRTILLPSLASELAGALPTPERIAGAAAATVRHDLAPIDDVRSTAAYRRLVSRNVLRSMLTDLCASRW